MRTAKYLIFFAVLLISGCYSKHDETDALNVAAKINSQLQQGDFASIYRQAGPSFRQEGDESKYVSVMTQYFKETGALRKITPRAYQSGVDSKAGRHHVLLFDLEFERGHGRERMVFTRSASGQMELWDLSIDPLP